MLKCLPGTNGKKHYSAEWQEEKGEPLPMVVLVLMAGTRAVCYYLHRRSTD
jgi:hypothetical protein